MKSTFKNFLCCAAVLLAVLVLAISGGQKRLAAATTDSDLTVNQILDRVETQYANSKFSADFIQKSTLKAMDITDMANGKVYIKYPGMMRWEYEKPDQQIIITDADKLWIYRPADNQVMTGKAPTFFRDGKGASFLSNIRVIRKKFDISLEQSPPEESDLFYHLKLIPREKTLDISEIRLLVSQKTFNVLQVITLNFYGDETRIDLLNFAFRDDLDDSLFSFEIPKGVDVIQIDE
ncbi:MAG: outer membrane lipoprotein carrier protein LolA [Desulfobacterales bacterium]|jgi:outer membrane lipoprotein carrier protein